MTRTTRIFVGVTVALVVTGGVVLYVGTRGQPKLGFEEHLPRRGPVPAGFAAGRLHVLGGPRHPGSAPVTPDSPMSGTVEVHRQGGPVPLFDAPIGANGLFRIQLPPGNYRLVPRPTTGAKPPDSQDVTVRDGQTVHVDFVIVAS